MPPPPPPPLLYPDTDNKADYLKTILVDLLQVILAFGGGNFHIA